MRRVLILAMTAMSLQADGMTWDSTMGLGSPGVSLTRAYELLKEECRQKRRELPMVLQISAHSLKGGRTWCGALAVVKGGLELGFEKFTINPDRTVRFDSDIEYYDKPRHGTFPQYPIEDVLFICKKLRIDDKCIFRIGEDPADTPDGVSKWGVYWMHGDKDEWVYLRGDRFQRSADWRKWVLGDSRAPCPRPAWQDAYDASILLNSDSSPREELPVSMEVLGKAGEEFTLTARLDVPVEAKEYKLLRIYGRDTSRRYIEISAKRNLWEVRDEMGRVLRRRSGSGSGELEMTGGSVLFMITFRQGRTTLEVRANTFSVIAITPDSTLGTEVLSRERVGRMLFPRNVESVLFREVRLFKKAMDSRDVLGACRGSP